MGMPVPKRLYTVDDLESMPDDDNRYEIIDGELFVSQPPRLAHQRVVMALVRRLDPHARSLGLELFVAPTDVRVSMHTQVEPDLFALPRIVDLDDDTRFVAMSQLLLAIEALSPSTQRLDRNRKRRLYLSEGVREYWIVDAKKRLVEVWTADRDTAQVVTGALTWRPIIGRDALDIDLVEVFNEVYG